MKIGTKERVATGILLVTIGVIALALVATLVPARKALRLDPMEELRAD